MIRRRAMSCGKINNVVQRDDPWTLKPDGFLGRWAEKQLAA